MMLMPSPVRLYLALNPDLKIIGAQDAGTQPLTQYQCYHCQAVLSLHKEGREYYFMHVNNAEEQKCSYCQARLNPLYRHFELVGWWAWLPPLVPVRHWFCTLCQRDYHGPKGCPYCQHSVYSTEAALRDTSSATKSDWSLPY
nr:putative zinc ribbon protein [Providencia alcalifaciens]